MAILGSIFDLSDQVRRGKVLWLADTVKKRPAGPKPLVEKLFQAILAKAFRGELVPTEAELARRERRTYEPASVLLERIRAEPAQYDCKLTSKRKTRKGRP